MWEKRRFYQHRCKPATLCTLTRTSDKLKRQILSFKGSKQVCKQYCCKYENTGRKKKEKKKGDQTCRKRTKSITANVWVTITGMQLCETFTKRVSKHDTNIADAWNKERYSLEELTISREWVIHGQRIKRPKPFKVEVFLRVWASPLLLGRLKRCFQN